MAPNCAAAYHFLIAPAMLRARPLITAPSVWLHKFDQSNRGPKANPRERVIEFIITAGLRGPLGLDVSLQLQQR